MNFGTETYEKTVRTLDGALYLSMMRQGCASLEKNRTAVNDLNVFPIPDGDTGDNMYMTVCSACESAANAGTSLQEVAAACASGALMGARGNSGVILSRIIAGISKGLKGLDSADVSQFADALQKGVEESYGAVSDPVEGTILTVWRESVDKVKTSSPKDYVSCMNILSEEMTASLEKTPELLDVLKQAGVVDSGGAGLLYIVRGMQDALNGENDFTEGQSPSDSVKTVDFNLFGKDDVLKYGYCTEFLLRLQSSKVDDPEHFDESVIRSYLNSAGESVVCFREGSIVKVHVHTNSPGDILNRCQQWGEFLTLKIENMTLQHNGTHPGAEPKLHAEKKFGVIAVASGEGFGSLFREAGADCVIEGGQTMNPSVQSFLSAFDSVKARHIFVFPNNSNIILTARQAAELYDKSKVTVIPSKDPGSGYLALASLDFSCTEFSEIEAAVCESLASSVTCYVSRAVRDSDLGGMQIREGDFVGISEGKIVASATERGSLLLELANISGISGHEVAVIFKGADVPEDEFQSSLDSLRKAFPRTEIIRMDGGQPVYDYIIVLC